MAMKIKPIVLDGHNYVVWVLDMETLLKSKTLWQYMKKGIPYPTDVAAKFFIDRKKDEAIGVIMTYILREIFFHTCGIDYPCEVWNKLKGRFDKVDESHVMQMTKELISFNHHSFEIIEDYLARMKEFQLKLGECGKYFPRKTRNSFS